MKDKVSHMTGAAAPGPMWGGLLTKQQDSQANKPKKECLKQASFSLSTSDLKKLDEMAGKNRSLFIRRLILDEYEKFSSQGKPNAKPDAEDVLRASGFVRMGGAE